MYYLLVLLFQSHSIIESKLKVLLSSEIDIVLFFTLICSSSLDKISLSKFIKSAGRQDCMILQNRLQMSEVDLYRIS